MRISEPERKAEQRSEEATGTPTSRYIANAPIKYLDQTPVDYRGRAQKPIGPKPHGQQIGGNGTNNRQFAKKTDRRMRRLLGGEGVVIEAAGSEWGDS
jgi:hypothetical protein